VKDITANLLRQSVLGPKLLDSPLRARDILPDGNVTDEFGKAKSGLLIAAAAAAAATVTYPTLSADKDATCMPPPPYFVNFSPELSTLIRECKLLDRMGYPIPEVAMNVALQEDKLNDYVARLQQMLERYHHTLSQLTPIEANLMQVQLCHLRASIRAGFTPLNWNSLHVTAYISDVNKALQDFDNVLGQVRKSCALLEDSVNTIGNTVLLSVADFDAKAGIASSAGSPSNYAVMEVLEVYDTIEKQRTAKLESLVHKYKSVRPVMQQIEGLIAGTDSCASPALAEFYRYWERRFFNAITKMIISSMVTFQALLNFVPVPSLAAKDGHHAASLLRRPPLIRVKASYIAPDVILSPDVPTITKYLRRAVYQILKSSKAFLRWMDGTCMEVEVQVPQGEAPPDFSFVEDIRQNHEIVGMLMALHPSVLKVLSHARRFTLNWSKYGSSYGLWAPRKPEAEKRLIEKAPTAVYFDTRLAAYAKLADSVDNVAVIKDIGFLRVDCSPVAVACKTQALKLKSEFGHALREIAHKRLLDFITTMRELNNALDVKPFDLTSLKQVLAIVGEVLHMKVEMDLALADIQERFRTLAMHEIEVDAEEQLAAETLNDTWQSTVDAALTKNRRLVKVKDEFREVTRNDVVTFVGECDAMRKQFFEKGPSSMGVSLADGLASLAEYRSKLAEANRKREELMQAERLFDLSMTRYGQLQEIQDDIDRVAPLYELYSDQMAFAETNSNMLWADLDIAAVQKGADDLFKRLQRLKDLKGSSVYLAVSDEISAFKDAVPLISTLKNPAMKERHWEKISVMTGIKINSNPKAFTLGSIFAMNLSRYTEQINEIVNEAKQEQKIERDLRAIIDKWAATSFAVGKYMKNGEHRGFVLKPADEVKLDLDDHLLNLQAMSSSRFVATFQGQVSEWEKKLNLVAEVMEVWFNVQTKWQYLEGIFVGSEDIRLQLPEEAKKFGAIDKEWKNIMAATAKNPNVIDASCETGRLDTLASLGERLDNCQKSLSDYLNTKRNAFPRFFFISDDELLSVLGTSDATSIKVHLLKLFDNVKDFGFIRNNKFVNFFGSSEGEGFYLRTNAPIEGAVETWMTGVSVKCEHHCLPLLRRACSNTRAPIDSPGWRSNLAWLLLRAHKFGGLGRQKMCSDGYEMVTNTP
jgi:dynein heavy chain